MSNSELPKGWRECKLGDVAKLSRSAWKVGDEKALYIGLEHIEEDKLRLNGVGKSDDVSSNKFRFRAGDTLFGKLRPYFRKVIKPDFDGICSTDIWVINPQNNIDKNYLFYFFANKELVDVSYSSSSGTRMPRADWKYLSQTIWDIPPLAEQKAIAEVLSSLDDKIDLLHQQNQTLEDMAQTLFREWFIEKADEGWEDGSLGEVVDIFDSKRVPLSKMKRDKMKDGKLYPYYGAAKIMDYVNDYIFDGEYILMGEDGTVKTDDGYPILQYATGKFWVNNHTHVLKAKDPFSNYFIWNYLLNKNIEKIVTGAVQPKINQTNLKALDFPRYPLELVREFNCQSQYLLEKIQQNKKQIKTLEQTRDTLLPKLMSGQVRV
ncbi:restriction endonuclease subunit S [Francisella tularensis]|uniref:restriction endonuclease subunit S n=1 Tax=Francisella tularensis TaxID=263 RepID=UPI001C0EEB60|nr:restriction endonuclease subunit S [Francisella tularensis]MBK2109689.1 restriction endonuclease subunit S [Francisella tularensis subsp. novicida FSC595]